jgi:hypothetical protein
MSELVLLIVIVAMIAWQIKTVSSRKAEIRLRAHKDFEVGYMPTIEELQNRLSESELQYEELEHTYWVHIGVFVGIAAQLYWNIWYVSIAIALFTIFVGVKFLSSNPFTSKIAN